MRILPKTTLIFFALAASLLGQTARWEPSGGSLAFGQTSQLQLVFDGCAPKGQPSLPAADGLSLQYAGKSSSTSIVNGTVSRSETLAYAVRPTRKTGVSIPEFSIDTDKGRITVPAASYSVGEATVGNGVSLESIANSTFTVPATVWAGEVFPIEYDLNVRQRNAPNPQNLLGSLLDWKPAPLVLEDWSKPAARDSLVGGETYITVYQNSRALVAQPGTITLPEGTQLVNIAKGVDFFGRYVLDQFSITSNRPSIQVKPLPSPAPTGFNGAVGQFTLKANVVPAVASIGEPVTWTLTLSGTGNWPDFPGLPARSVSKDFRPIQPQARRTPKEGQIFDATLVEDVVLIPTKAGSYTLSPITWSYFDPAKGEYQTLTTAPAIVTITAAPEPAAGSASPASGYTPSSNAGKPPAMPKGIPRDPLPDSGCSAEPMEASRFAAVLCAPAAALVLFWLWLAFRRAYAGDPARPRRDARKRLLATLDALEAAKAGPGVAPLLQSWQKDVAILWNFASAAPSASAFPAGEKQWSGLWSDSERALYRDATPLPADWVNRARGALAQTQVPGFSFWSLFRAGNLLPFAALLAVGLALAAPAVRADEGLAAYNRSDFAAAEKAWRSSLATAPANASLHHNLSLALAQQDRWGEAAAQAAAAFVQQPGDEAIRWNLAFSLERAGYAPSVFSGFAAANPPHQVARLFSPAQWQWLGVLATGLAALGAALLLVRAYGRPRAWLKYSAMVLFVCSVLLGAATALSLHVYSPINDARAAIVWHTTVLRSIPTEVETNQKTSSLPAGSVAVIDQHFIGHTWTRLVFSNGQTGWVRNEELVPLWR